MLLGFSTDGSDSGTNSGIEDRDSAYHQGTVRPALLSTLSRAILAAYPNDVSRSIELVRIGGKLLCMSWGFELGSVPRVPTHSLQLRGQRCEASH